MSLEVVKERRPRRKDKGKGKEKEKVAEALELPKPPEVPLTRPPTLPPWSWGTLSDLDVSKAPPTFTKDSQYFFLASASSVKIFSIATGHVVSTLSANTSRTSPDSPPARITALFLNPQNPFQLFTASSDGHIQLWDFLDAVVLQTLAFGLPITHLCAHSSAKGYLFIVVEKATTSNQSSSFTVYRISLKPSHGRKASAMVRPSDTLKVGKLSGKPTGFTISPSGAWLVATSGFKAHVAPMSDLSASFTKFISPDPITCLAFHPSEEVFATGDAVGVIRLWYCLDPKRLPWTKVPDDPDRKAPTTTLHWHAHPVSSIAFTPNGAYLLSGGEESVLVVWQLESGHREYLPRLGAPIQSISVIPSSAERVQEYFLGLVDGSMHLVESSNFKITKTFSQLKHNSQSLSGSPAALEYIPLAVHPSTSYIVMPSSHPSSLQIYSSKTPDLISELEVAPSNRVSRRDETPVEPVRVSHSVICPGFSTPGVAPGEWMATVDYRHGGDDFGSEVTLKIWRWEGSQFILNTRIDRPHGKGRVTSVSFNPASADAESCILVTTGDNGFVRTWKVTSTFDKKGHEEVFWAPRSTFHYRAQIPRNAIWTPDGSILAVAQGPYVTLWDPFSNSLLNVLTCPEIPVVVDICCVGANGRYMVVAGTTGIVLWDLVFGSVRWHYSDVLLNTHLIAHPSTDTFALLRPTPRSGETKSSYVLVFSATSPQPVRAHTLPFVLVQLAWLGSTNARDGKFSLVGITSDWASVVLGDEIKVNTPEGSVARDLSNLPASRTRPTLFQDIFGPSAFVGLEQAQMESYGTTSFDASTSKALRPANVHGLDLGLLDGPAHLLPPIESLFSSLIRGFIQPGASSASSDSTPDDPVIDGNGTNGEPPSMEDVEMEDDSPSIHLTPPADRIVDKREMEEFTELFRRTLVGTKHATGPPPSGASNSHSPTAKWKETHPITKPSNGISTTTTTITTTTVNGNGQGHGVQANGVHQVPTTPSGSKSRGGLPKSVNGAPSSVGRSPRTDTDSPTTGQKRKKSSGG